MLEAVLTHLSNWFDRNPASGYSSAVEGRFKVADGGIDVPDGFLKDGQYLRIVGSAFNDGLHQWPCADLVDEEFRGCVWALWVPAAVVSLAEDVAAWVEANGEDARSPFQSESFGGYTYSIASGGSAVATWQAAFRTELNRWRKL